jgi:amino acid transporter
MVRTSSKRIGRLADPSGMQIAIGGTIGTGLFVGSGGALAAGGPVGVWVSSRVVAFSLPLLTHLQLGYIFMATIVYSMVALGGESSFLRSPPESSHLPAEMVTLYPVAGAFTHYATRFLDPAFGKVFTVLARPQF